jgi:hypothetical protein
MGEMVTDAGTAVNAVVEELSFGCMVLSHNGAVIQ